MNYRDPSGTLWPSEEYYESRNKPSDVVSNQTTMPITAPTSMPATPDLSVLTGKIDVALLKMKEATSTADLQAGEVDAFIPPASTALTTQETYTQSMLDVLEKQRATLDATYKNQLDNFTKQKEDAQKRYDDLVAQQKDVLETDVKPLTEPFRADIEETERERLKVEENYFANQTLTNELEGLLTQIQNDLIATRDVTGLASIREPRIAKATEEMTARVGVIQATMASRNNQISVANNLIDRTVTAMTADRQDQLNYYNSLLNFYSGQADVEGNKIIQLTTDEKSMISSQISLLENDMAITLSTVENIKEAMLDPDTAMAYAQSGVTLNDTPEQINEKLAKYAYTQELADTSNAMAEQGYKAGTGPAGSDVVTTTDSKGNTKQWYKEAGADLLSVAEANSLGVPYGTTRSAAYGLTSTTEGIKFSSSDKGRIAVTGLSNSEIDQIESDINEYGWEETKKGLASNQVKAIEEVLSGLTPLQATQPTTQEKAIADLVSTIDDYKEDWANSGDEGAGTRDDFIDKMDAIFPELDRQTISDQVYKWVTDEWLKKNKPSWMKGVINWISNKLD